MPCLCAWQEDLDISADFQCSALPAWPALTSPVGLAVHAAMSSCKFLTKLTARFEAYIGNYTHLSCMLERSWRFRRSAPWLRPLPWVRWHYSRSLRPRTDLQSIARTPSALAPQPLCLVDDRGAVVRTEQTRVCGVHEGAAVEGPVSRANQRAAVDVKGCSGARLLIYALGAGDGGPLLQSRRALSRMLFGIQREFMLQTCAHSCTPHKQAFLD